MQRHGMEDNSTDVSRHAQPGIAPQSSQTGRHGTAKTSMDQAVGHTTSGATSTDSKEVLRDGFDSVTVPFSGKIPVLSHTPRAEDREVQDEFVIRHSLVSVSSTYRDSTTSTTESIFSNSGPRFSTASTTSTRDSVPQSPSIEEIAQSLNKKVEGYNERERYGCTQCETTFLRLALLVSHYKDVHGLDKTPAAKVIRSSAIRSAWGCGFCAASLQSRNDYLEHLGRHYDDGDDRGQWDHSKVIVGLLQQPKLQGEWGVLMSNLERVRGATPRLFWDFGLTGRSPDPMDKGSPQRLQDMLEFFATSTTTPQAAVQKALDAAQSTADEAAGEQILFQEVDFTPDAQVKTLILSPTGSTLGSPSVRVQTLEKSDHSPPQSPCTIPKPPSTSASPRPALASARLPQLSALTIGKTRHNASLRTLAIPRASVRGSLRRVDSSRNLCVSGSGTDLRGLNKLEIERPRTATAIMLPSASLDVAPQVSEEGMLRAMDLGGTTSLSPATLGSALDKSHTRKQGRATTRAMDSLASTRSLSSSSSQSMRPTGIFRSLYDSSSDCMPDDDSVSELDSELGCDAISVATRSWNEGFERVMSRVMGPLWIQFNRSWDALIRECAGKRFACQFRKYDPHKYNRQDHWVCAMKDWPNVSRLKEHLYRKHCIVHCQRCKETFKDNGSLTAHEMRAGGCSVRACPSPGDISLEHERLLRSRKNPGRHTDEEKWLEIYEMLFPHAAHDMPSPYPQYTEDLGPVSAKSQNDHRFQHYLLSEVPRLFQRGVEEHTGRQTQLLMNSISSILDASLREAFSSWEAIGNDLPSRAGSDASSQDVPFPEVSIQDVLATSTTSGDWPQIQHINIQPYGQWDQIAQARFQATLTPAEGWPRSMPDLDNPYSMDAQSADYPGVLASVEEGFLSPFMSREPSSSGYGGMQQWAGTSSWQQSQQHY